MPRRSDTSTTRVETLHGRHARPPPCLRPVRRWHRRPGQRRHDPLLAVRPTSSAAVMQRSPARDTTQVGVITPPLRVIGISCTMDMPRQPRVTLTDITNTSTSDQAGAVDAAAPRRQERNKQQRKRRSEMSDEQREEINRKQHEYRARKKGRVKPHLPYRRPHSNHDILHIGSSESKPFCQSTV